MTRHLLSLGSINADFQMRVDQPLGAQETSVADMLVRLGGGKAANVAYLAARLGCHAELLGCVGDDDLAEQALRGLPDVGVDLRGVTRVPGGTTAVSIILVPPEGKKAIVLAPQANDQWSQAATEVALQAIGRAANPALLVVDCEIPAEVVASAVAAARARGLPVILDPSFPTRVDPAWLSQVDAITPNLEEARQLCGLSRGAPPVVLRTLRARGAPVVCLKLPDGGCLFGDAHESFALCPPAVDVVDSTGAGDAFTGAFAVRWLEGASPQQAATFAVAAAALAVETFGSQPAYPRRARIEARLSEVVRRPLPDVT